MNTKGLCGIIELRGKKSVIADDTFIIFYPPYDLHCFARGFVEFRLPLYEALDLGK